VVLAGPTVLFEELVISQTCDVELGAYLVDANDICRPLTRRPGLQTVHPRSSAIANQNRIGIGPSAFCLSSLGKRCRTSARWAC